MPTQAKKKPKSKPKAKATKAEFEVRATQVLQWLLNGAPRYEIVRLSSEKWKVGERQTQDYIARAHEFLVASLEPERTREIAVGVAQRQGLYALALESGDYKAALSVLTDLAKLRGLYPADKQEITGKDGGPVVTVYIPANGREVK